MDTISALITRARIRKGIEMIHKMLVLDPFLHSPLTVSSVNSVVMDFLTRRREAAKSFPTLAT